MVIAAKDSATDSIRKIKGEAKMLVSRPFTAVFKAKDEISGVIKNITDKVFSLKTLAAGVILGGASKAAFDSTIGSAARIEQEKVAMNHFVKNANPGADSTKIQKVSDDFIAQLRQNANETPFGTNEVLSAGRRAINIVNGDTKKSMDLVNLAEDMSALNPGKSVMDSMEALADLKTGEFERMKEFGFKFSADQFKGLVGKGPKDTLTDAENNAAYDLLVKNSLSPTFKGGAKELSNTVAGQWSTTTGNLEAMGADLGSAFLPAINKVLIPINAELDKIGKSKAFANLQSDLMKFAGEGANKAVNFLKGFENKDTVQQYENEFNKFVKSAKEFKDAMIEIGRAGKTVYEALQPFLQFLIEHPKLLEGFFAVKIGGSLLKGGFDSFKNIKEMIKEFPKLEAALKTMVKNGGGGLKGVLKLPFTGLKDAFGFGKDIAKWIPGLFSVTGKNITSTFKGGQSVIKNFFGLFPKGVKSAISALNTFKSTLKGVSLIKPLQEAFAGFKNLGVIKELPKTLSEVFGPVKTLFSSLGNVIKIFSNGAVKALRTFFTVIAANPVVATIIGIIAIAALLYEAWIHDWGGIQEKTQSVINEIKLAWDGLEKAWERLKEFFANPIQATIKFVQEGTAVTVPKGTTQGGGSGPQGLAIDSGNFKFNAIGTNNWMGGLTWVGENGPELIELPSGSKIYSNSKSMSMLSAMKAPAVGISKTMTSLTSQFLEWGKDMPAELAKGIDSLSDNAVNSVTSMANKIKRIIHFTKPDEGPLRDSDTYGPDMVKSISTGIQNNVSVATNATTLMATNMRNVITQLIKDTYTYGQQIVSELGRGVQDTESSLVDIVKTLTDKVIEQFKSGFGIHSPSIIMYKIGSFLLKGLINGMTSEDMQGFIKNWIGSMVGAAGGAVSGNLAEWITAAMALTGVSSDWFGPLASIIEHESGGDPMSINLWDSNAAAGHPSKGLMQLIDENMSDYHLPGMDNIYDPISNIAAGIRYIQDRYGSVYNVPGIRNMASGGSYVGYALGTSYSLPGWHWVGENGPELMNLPGGTQVKDNFTSMKMAKSLMQPLQNKKLAPLLNKDTSKVIVNLNKDNSKQSPNINIAKLAEQIIVREEADIGKITDALTKKLLKVHLNMA